MDLIDAAEWLKAELRVPLESFDLTMGEFRVLELLPFLGGGAVFFYLGPRISVLSDVNAELVETYQAVRDRVADVSAALRGLPVSKRDFYRIRRSSPAGAVARAARFLYLNRTAFSGIYRVNQRGEFNVPYGGGQRTPRILLNTPRLQNASATLRSAQLRRSDFEPMLQSARPGDVVYCDPTYTVMHDNNGFVRYNEENFSWADQERLAKSGLAAARRGVRVLVTNAHHAEVRKLYRGAARYTLVRSSTLCADPSRRREVKEYLMLL
ncbi:MAG: Dam family site-specific DNA-(adenine-N6)-methyltransferase [Candidatus Acidiferrales bacterium]